MMAVSFRRRCCDKTFRELEARFGAVSAERQTIVGAWREGVQSYQDELVRMFVDVPRSSEHDRFFLEPFRHER